MGINVFDIRHLCQSGLLRWTDHAVKRLIKRAISRADVKQTLLNGKVIEQYPDDYPFPSCLVSGVAQDGRYLHVVCGIDAKELWIISSYHPDPEKWTDDFSKRKEN